MSNSTTGDWGTYLPYMPTPIVPPQTESKIRFYVAPKAEPVAETAPTRATTFPNDAQGRKEHPVASGVLDYFPDALVAISKVSFVGNEQHNPGQPLHWARGKSTDESDALVRHFLQRGTTDTDGVRHSAKMAWRALALLQKEIEADQRKQQDFLSPIPNSVMVGAPVENNPQYIRWDIYDR